METSLWKLGNPLLAVSPWHTKTWFLALAPLGHGAQVVSMIVLLAVSTRLTALDEDGVVQKQIAIAPSYVRYCAINIVRLSIHVLLESWLVYRHSRKYRPQPWLLGGGDVEEGRDRVEGDGADLALEHLRPREEVGRVPTPHPDPSPSYAVPPSSGTESEPADGDKVGEKANDTSSKAEEERNEAEVKKAEDKAKGEQDTAEETAEDKPEVRSSSSDRTRSSNSTDVVPALTSAPADTAMHPRTTTSSSSSSSPLTKPRRARLLARSDSPKDHNVATAEAILADPPAQIAAFTASSAAEAAKRRAERLQRYDSMASNTDLWVCCWGFIMWVVGMIVAFPPEPARSRAPLVFAATMVSMTSNWFTALGFTVCFLLWSLGYVIVMIAWLLWHLGVIRGAQPVIFARAAAKKLPKDELDKCPLVIYAADPEEEVPEWEDLPGRPLSLSEIDREKLTHPLRVLGANKATCGICHTEFLPPCIKDGQEEYELEVLRELPCLHTFHRECVDEWLLNHADTCPYCTQSVPAMLKDPGKAKAAGQSRAEDGENGELAELRRTMSRRRSQRSVRSVRSISSVKSNTSMSLVGSVRSAKQSVTSNRGEGPSQSKPRGADTDTASISSADSDDFHDSREITTPTPASMTRNPSMSTAYETAASSLALASLRTATPSTPTPIDMALRSETPVTLENPTVLEERRGPEIMGLQKQQKEEGKN